MNNCRNLLNKHRLNRQQQQKQRRHRETTVAVSWSYSLQGTTNHSGSKFIVTHWCSSISIGSEGMRRRSLLTYRKTGQEVHSEQVLWFDVAKDKHVLIIKQMLW